ncbi:MAG TPA: hypothetical protein VJ625_09185 [Propionibacteriaceae bacterium]|nr:hypothetical protein [Propionibacteriaceae bacterium]
MAEYVGDIADNTEGLFRIAVPRREVTVSATGEPAVLHMEVMNTSAMVDGYAVEPASAPQWLEVESSQIRVIPGGEEALPVIMRVVSPTLVPAQQILVRLRIRSLSQAPAHAVLPVLITVPVQDVPVRLHAEPSVLRVRDRDSATCRVVVDNSGSNHPVHLRFTGSDPERAVRFHFEPAVLELGPAASGSVLVTLTATPPEPGQEITRPLTVSAVDRSRRAGTVITFVQTAGASDASGWLVDSSSRAAIKSPAERQADGRLDVPVEGSLVEFTGDERRPLARLLLTLFGALAMILGVLLPWRAVSDQRGVDLDIDTFAQAFGYSINLRGAEFLISVGLVIMLLAILMILGMTGRSGRLTEVAAVFAGVLLIGTFVLFAVAGDGITPARGAILVLAGCIAGYIGGLLARR